MTNKINEKSMKMAESFLERARHGLDDARNHLKNRHFPESISASQECIELSTKAIFLLFQKEYPKRHEFKEEEFEAVLRKIPEKLQHLDFPKLYIYSKFWSSFYTLAKYGSDKLGVEAKKLFGEDEAELALKHAEKCESTAFQLENYIKNPW